MLRRQNFTKLFNNGCSLASITPNTQFMVALNVLGQCDASRRKIKLRPSSKSVRTKQCLLPYDNLQTRVDKKLEWAWARVQSFYMLSRLGAQSELKRLRLRLELKTPGPNLIKEF